MIKLDAVSKRYENGHEGLSRVSLDIADGEMVFLTGHSGAGKSTLLKLLLLMERPTNGQLWVADNNITRVQRAGIAMHRRNVGMIFQNHQLLFDRSVFDNVALPLVIAGYSSHEIGRRVRAALDKVGLLSKEKMLPIMLSGGEQQRVGIARAVVNKPPLLLADEPTGNLDPALSREILNLFKQFNQVGVTVFIATHDVELIKEYDHRLLSLKQGQLVVDQQHRAATPEGLRYE